MEMGPYELAEVVGRGGMSIVYRGHHRLTGQVVAVKVLDAELAADPVVLRRFEQEFQAACRLRHPHIVEGLDFGVHDGRPYLVMEFVAGGDLNQRVRTRGRLPEADAVRLISQVAEALQA